MVGACIICFGNLFRITSSNLNDVPNRDKRARFLGIDRADLAMFLDKPKAYKILGLFDTHRRPLRPSDEKMLRQQQVLARGGGLTSSSWLPDLFLAGTGNKSSLTSEEANGSSGRTFFRRNFGLRHGPRAAQPWKANNGAISSSRSRRLISAGRGGGRGAKIGERSRMPRYSRKAKRLRMLGMRSSDLQLFLDKPKAYKILGLWDEAEKPPLRPSDVKMLKDQQKRLGRYGRLNSTSNQRRRAANSAVFSSDANRWRTKLQILLNALRSARHFSSTRAHHRMSNQDQTSPPSPREIRQRMQPPQREPNPGISSIARGREAPASPRRFRQVVPSNLAEVPPKARDLLFGFQEFGPSADKSAATLGISTRDLTRFQDKPKAYKYLGLWTPHGHMKSPMSPENLKILKSQEPFKRLRDEALGYVRVLLHYDKLRHLLDVTVVEAKGLPALSGAVNFSDPCIELRLVKTSDPTYTTGLSAQRTTVKRRTLDPVFNESFQFPLLPRRLARRKLLLSVWDYRGSSGSSRSVLGYVLLDLRHLRRADQACEWHPIFIYITSTVRGRTASDDECDSPPTLTRSYSMPNIDFNEPSSIRHQSPSDLYDMGDWLAVGEFPDKIRPGSASAWTQVSLDDSHDLQALYAKGHSSIGALPVSTEMAVTSGLVPAGAATLSNAEGTTIVRRGRVQNPMDPASLRASPHAEDCAASLQLYEPTMLMGSGANGFVLRVTRKDTKQEFAMKVAPVPLYEEKSVLDLAEGEDVGPVTGKETHKRFHLKGHLELREVYRVQAYSEVLISHLVSSIPPHFANFEEAFKCDSSSFRRWIRDRNLASLESSPSDRDESPSWESPDDRVARRLQVWERYDDRDFECMVIELCDMSFKDYLKSFSNLTDKNFASARKKVGRVMRRLIKWGSPQTLTPQSPPMSPSLESLSALKSDSIPSSPTSLNISLDYNFNAAGQHMVANATTESHSTISSSSCSSSITNDTTSVFSPSTTYRLSFSKFASLPSSPIFGHHRLESDINLGAESDSATTTDDEGFRTVSHTQSAYKTPTKSILATDEDNSLNLSGLSPPAVHEPSNTRSNTESNKPFIPVGQLR